MSDVIYSTPRRSPRVFMRVHVWVSGKNADGRKFREASQTIVINAYGGLLYLNQPVENDTMLVLSSPATQEEQEVRVVYLGEVCEKGQRVGVEFLTPSPHFWGVEFTPADEPSRAESLPPN